MIRLLVDGPRRGERDTRGRWWRAGRSFARFRKTFSLRGARATGAQTHEAGVEEGTHKERPYTGRAGGRGIRGLGTRKGCP